jgi:hypothetical protein
MVNLDVDAVSTVPTAPPSAGPDRALEPGFAGVAVPGAAGLVVEAAAVVGAAALPLEVVLAMP